MYNYYMSDYTINASISVWTSALGGAGIACLLATAMQLGPAHAKIPLFKLKSTTPVPVTRAAISGIYKSSASLQGYTKTELAGPFTISPEQVHVAHYIAKEWRLGTEYTMSVVSTAYQAAVQHKLDPLLLLAMAERESSFRHIGNPDGGRNPAKPYGILQVAGRYHAEHFAQNVVKPTSVVENIYLGAAVYREYLEKEDGNERRALLRYNGALATGGRYAHDVRHIQQMLHKVAMQQATGAEVAKAAAAAQQADGPRIPPQREHTSPTNGAKTVQMYDRLARY